MAAIASFATLLALACSPASSGSQYDYTYENCERGGILCPNDQTIACALDKIVDKHNACTRDEDCVASDVADDCVGLIGCHGPPPVNQSEKAAFETEFKAELGKYCATATCTSKTACAPGDRKNVISCFEGACTRSFKPLDSGFPDAGTFIPFDAGIDAGTDAGVDAGFDAGFDAGTDAGADAGDGGP